MHQRMSAELNVLQGQSLNSQTLERATSNISYILKQKSQQCTNCRFCTLVWFGLLTSNEAKIELKVMPRLSHPSTEACPMHGEIVNMQRERGLAIDSCRP